jgi:TonB-linked SusC/RagA family outer membrane protein
MLFTATGKLKRHALRLPFKPLLVMKLIILLTFVATFNASAGVVGQNITLSKKDATLESIFKEIKKQSGYDFVYNSDWLIHAGRISIDVTNAPIRAVLDMCFKGQPFSYEINDRLIVVKKVSEVNIIKGGNAVPPSVVSGIITGENGEPLAGATVMIKSLGKSGQTNEKGEFILKNIPNGVYKVEVSFVGYERSVTEVVVVNNTGKLSLFLKKSLNSLDATVIKGYYNSTQRLNTGDVTTVKGEDIQMQPVTDPLLALEGRVPGLYIQQTSGVPGAYSTILLRGQNFIHNINNPVYSDNDPLYIIDGVPFNSTPLTSGAIGGGVVGSPGNGVGQGMSPFNSLNPLDIESIEVLKDADATAIYGSRGANGVILITTKKGNAGNTKFDANVYTGTGKVTRTLNMLNTQQYLQMRNESFINDAQTPNPTYDYDLTFWDTTRFTNWQRVLLDNRSPFTNAQVNLSGGNVNTQFLIGGGFSKQGTVFPGNYSDQKGSMHINLTHASLDQRFHVLFTASYLDDNSTLPQADFTGSITLPPNAPAIYDANGNLNWQPNNGTATWTNPLASTVLHANAVTDNLISNLAFNFQLLPGLQVKSSFGFNHTQMNQSIITPATIAAPPYNNDPDVRSNDFATTDLKTWIIEPQINYLMRIGKGKLDALAGATFQQNIQNSLSQGASGFASDALISDPLAATTNYLFAKTYSLYRYTAVFSRINYNWQEKYLINITGRRDGSSRFGPGRQFGNFGAVGTGWIFSKEKFMEYSPSFVNFGKLRASYGITGSDQIANYQYLSTYTPYSPTYQGNTGLTPTGLSNPYYSWEGVKKLEAALELGFLESRILLTFSYYRNRTNNQLVGYPLPALTGFTTVQANLPAIVQNTGKELSINTINIKVKDFTWTSALNLTIPESKLIAYPNIGNSSYSGIYAVGQSIFAKQLYNYTGVNPQTGLYTFSTKNINAIPSYPQDLELSKPITQKFYGGIQNSFTYKGLHLDIFIQFVKQLGYNYLPYFNMPGIAFQNLPTVVMSRWQKVGNNTNIEKFSQTVGTPFTAYQNLIASNAVISDASFIRLKNLSISYQLPTVWRKKALIQNARVYVQCQNLFTISKYLGLDPETGGLNLPPLRMITAGIQITL